MSEPSHFQKLCRQRRSVRRFSDRLVERDKLELCLEAARQAPSAQNKQPCRFVIFDDPAEKEKLTDVIFRGLFSVSSRFRVAPVLVALLVDENLMVNRLAGELLDTRLQLIDAGIAGEHFVLAATEQGLGTCWIGWYDSRALMRHLGLRGKGYIPAALIAVGYPAPDASTAERRRLSLSDIVFWNRPPR